MSRSSSQTAFTRYVRYEYEYEQAGLQDGAGGRRSSLHELTHKRSGARKEITDPAFHCQRYVSVKTREGKIVCRKSMERRVLSM